MQLRALSVSANHNITYARLFMICAYLLMPGILLALQIFPPITTCNNEHFTDSQVQFSRVRSLMKNKQILKLSSQPSTESRKELMRLAVTDLHMREMCKFLESESWA